MNNRSWIKKITAAALAGVLASMSVCTPIEAAAPTVQVDETMYVTTDYYGDIQDISIVKGCFLNGNDTIEDYGDYTSITNMSNRIDPIYGNGKLTWDLTDYDSELFYYEVRAKDLQKVIPWEVDVSYKLNGVPASGEELCGATGLVTTEIHVTPKKDIDEYYQNNMILVCFTLADMKKCKSIDAPGSQLQSLGTSKAVMFMALPGEECEYRVDIGADNYESYGIFFTMVPATAQNLEVFNDLREVRDTIKDSVDSADKALDVIFDNIGGMKDSLHSAQDGIEKAKEVHEILDANREGIEADADAAIDSLENIVTYLSVINTQTEADKENLDKSIDKLVELMRSIGALSGLGDNMSDTISGLRKNTNQLKNISKEVINQESVEILNGLLTNTGSTMMVQSYAENVTALKASEKASLAAGTEVEITSAQVHAAVAAIAAYLPVGMDLSTFANSVVSSGQPEALADAAALTQGYIKVVRGLGYEPENDGSISGNPEINADGASDAGLHAILSAYIEALEHANTEAGKTSSSLLTNTNSLLGKAKNTLDQVDVIAGNCQNISKWTDETIREDIMTLIDQLNDLIGETEVALSATQAAMQSIRSTMELTEDTLCSSIGLTLDGMTGILGGAAGVADSVDVLKDAKNTARKAYDDEIDELEEEYNLLDMDITQEFPSLTSDKNNSPASIQIVMRTAEINADDANNNAVDIEQPKANIGVWGRFCKVFTDLWAKIKSLFA